ncbi:MAG: glycosyltransferase family 4 protein [Oscillospiraceae bacterium]|nr:glycosyltransferase family 4 protein [Oscillospiraceae bacterium]
MKILLFTTIYPGAEDYGVPADTKAIHYFVREWEKQGHEIDIIYLYQNAIKRIKPQTMKEIFDGTEIDYAYENVPVHLFRYQLLVPHANELMPFQMTNFQTKVNRCVERLALQPNLIIVHFPLSYIGFDFSRFHGCRKFATFHNCDITGIEKFKLERTKFYLNQFDGFGCRSISIRSELNRRVDIKGSLVYSGISSGLIADYNFIQRKAERNIDVMKIVFCGNLIPLKNVDILIRTMKVVNFPYCLEIVGSGSEEKKLIRLVEEFDLGDHIRFLGRVTREESIKHMKDADVFVMVSKPETFGLVYIEAMSQGCLVVGSKNEGIDGVVKDGDNGFLVEPGNVEALKSTLEGIYRIGNEQKINIILKAYKTAMSMTDELMASSYLDIAGRGIG